MRYIKVAWNDTPLGYILDQDSGLSEEIEDLENADVGTQLVLTVVELSEEEYDALPDYSGE